MEMVEEIYAEVPQTWLPIVNNMISEVRKLESDNNLPINTIQFYEIKEKYNTLRIYSGIPQMLEDDLSYTQLNFFDSILIQLDEITDRYEKLVKDKIRKGEL